MREVVAKEWIAALRSGGYAQAENLLRCSTGFCATGVLCDLYAKASGITDFWKHGEVANFYLGDGYSSNVPPSVVAWAGINPKSGFVYTVGEYDVDEDVTPIENMNDEGVSFSEIAIYIEKNWETI